MTFRKLRGPDRCDGGTPDGVDRLASTIDPSNTQLNDARQLSDAEWFAAHPEADHRIRGPFPGELDEETARTFLVGVTRRAALAGTITAYIQRGVLS